MGLTSLKVSTFYWVSQLGMLAATVIYVNAGTQLARIESLSGVLSPALMGSLALLGCFPLLAKTMLTSLQARKVYKKWHKPKSLIIILSSLVRVPVDW
jgi:hypothetical protein